MPDTEDKVSALSTAYKAMSADYDWPLLATLRGGTKAMRDAGTKYLPKEEEETEAAYTNRKKRSFLYPAYDNTIRRLVSRPYAKPITLEGNLPEKLQPIVDDVDYTGRNLTQFGRDVLDGAMNYGLTHVLVDYPKVDDPRATTLGDERSKNLHPMFVHIPPANLIAWTYEVDASGRPHLTMIRIKETATEKDGTYKDKEVERIRVFTPTAWALYRKNPEKDEYEKESDGEHTFGAIPLVSYYINRTGYMQAAPPLLGLASLNLAHWQQSSDLNNVLHYTSIPILHRTGITDEDQAKNVTIGPARVITSSNPEATLSFVEHSGKAIGALQEALDKLEERMETMGLQPLVKRSGDITATGQAIDASKEQADMQAWVRSEEGALRHCFDLAGQWVNAPVPDDFAVNIYSDFVVGIRAAEDLKLLQADRARKDLSHETYINEQKRRGVLSENVTPQEEQARLEEEGPNYNRMPVREFGAPPNEEGA